MGSEVQHVENLMDDSFHFRVVVGRQLDTQVAQLGCQQIGCQMVVD